MIETLLFLLGVLLGTALGYAIKAARDQHAQIQIADSEAASVQIQVYVAKPEEGVNERDNNPDCLP